MIALQDLGVDAWQVPFFRLGPGHVAAMFSESEERQDQFLDTILGLRPPESGAVMLFGLNLYERSESDRLGFLTKVGAVPEDGGLISNLPACENILLPAAYHCGRSAEQCEAVVVAALRSIGLTDDDARTLLVQVPDKLSLFEKRLVALLRVMTLEPQLCIYQSLFDDLDHAAAHQLRGLATTFQAKNPERASLFTARQRDPLEEFVPGDVLELEDAI